MFLGRLPDAVVQPPLFKLSHAETARIKTAIELMAPPDKGVM